MSRLGNRAQSSLIQPALHHPAVGVAHHFYHALFIYDLNGAAGLRADANRKNHNAFLSQFLGGAHACLLQILAVGEQDHNFAPIILLHGAKTFIQRAPDIGARNRNCFLIDRQE